MARTRRGHNRDSSPRKCKTNSGVESTRSIANEVAVVAMGVVADSKASPVAAKVAAGSLAAGSLAWVAVDAEVEVAAAASALSSPHFRGRSK